MYKYITYLFLLCNLSMSAQTFTGEMDTIYYPFYNGVQMIEITIDLPKVLNDPQTNKPAKVISYPADWLGMELEMHRSPVIDQSMYIFRDKNGNIIQQFNVCGREVDFNALKPVTKLKRFSHHLPPTMEQRLKRSYAFRSHPGIYPVMQCFSASEKNKTKVGLIDSLGNFVLSFKYDEITYTDSSFIIRQEGKFGLLDRNFNIIIPLKYDRLEVENAYRNIYRVTLNGKSALINRKDEVLTPFEFEYIQLSKSHPGWYDVREKDKWGLINDKFKVVVPALYCREIPSFSHGYAKVCFNSPWAEGFIDSTGKQVGEIKYQYVKYFHKGLGYAFKDNLHYVLDENGKEIFISPHEVVTVLDKNRFIVKSDGKIGMVDVNNNIILGFNYYDIIPVKKNIFIAGVEGKEGNSYMYEKAKWIIINEKGKQIGKSFNIISKLDENTLITSDNENVGTVNKKGKKKIPDDYSSLRPFGKNALWAVTQNRKQQLIDLEGDSISAKYDYMYYAGSGLMQVQKNKMYGFIDSSGREIIPLQFEKAGIFINGYAQVVRNGKSTVIDNKGKEFSWNDYDEMEKAGQNAFLIRKNGKSGIADMHGKIIIPIAYDFIFNRDAYYELANISPDDPNGRLRGIADLQGKMIIPAEYSKMYKPVGDLFFISKNEKWGAVNMQGELTIPIDYDLLSYIYESGKVNYLWVRKNDKFGVITKKNEIVYPIIFDGKQDFSRFEFLNLPETFLGQLTLNRRDSIERRYINMNGELIAIRTSVNQNKGFKIINNYHVINHPNNWKYGIVNFNGDTVIAPKYNHISSLINHHFIVQDDARRQGLVDTTGKIIVPLKYDEVRFKGEKYVEVSLYKRKGLYDIKGNEIAKPIYAGFEPDVQDEIFVFSEAEKGREGDDAGRVKKGFMNRAGKIVITAQYDYIWFFDTDRKYFTVSQNRSYAIINRSGKIIAPFEGNTTPIKRWEKFMGR